MIDATGRGWGRWAAAVLVAAVAFTVASCGDGEDEPRPTVTTTAPTPQQQATAAYQRYWQVYVQLANSGVVDASAFAGVAEGHFVELDLKLLGDQADAGVVRVGEPTIGEYHTSVDGDTATSVTCVDESTWTAKKDGEDVPLPDDVEANAFKASLEKRDGAWIVTDVAPDEETTC